MPRTARAAPGRGPKPERVGLCLGDDGLKGLRVLGGQLLGNLRVQLAHIAEGLQRLQSPVATRMSSSERDHSSSATSSPSILAAKPRWGWRSRPHATQLDHRA